MYRCQLTWPSICATISVKVSNGSMINTATTPVFFSVSLFLAHALSLSFPSRARLLQRAKGNAVSYSPVFMSISTALRQSLALFFCNCCTRVALSLLVSFSLSLLLCFSSSRRLAVSLPLSLFLSLSLSLSLARFLVLSRSLFLRLSFSLFLSLILSFSLALSLLFSTSLAHSLFVCPSLVFSFSFHIFLLLVSRARVLSLPRSLLLSHIHSHFLSCARARSLSRSL